MELSIEALYEDGVLKPLSPLPLKEHEKVRVVVQSVVSPLVAAYGILKWSGDAETVDRFALSAEFDPNEEI